MKRLRTHLFVLSLVVTTLVAAGCAPKEEIPSGTSTDSTLSMNDLPEAVAPSPDTAIAVVETPPAPAPTPPPATSAKPKPKPVAKPAPVRVDPGVTVAAGTSIKVSFAADVSTKDKVAGDTFSATLAEDIAVEGKVVFPAGSTINGHVVEAERPGKASGRGKMVLAYDSIDAHGSSYAIDTVGAPIEGKSGTKGDATKVVGGAAAGAILGKILGGSGGDAAKGAAAGAAAGTAAALLTRGPDPVVKAGQTLTVSLDHPVNVKGL